MCEILEKERAEGREEGEKRVNELNQILIKQGQFPGLIKAVEDTEYRSKFLKPHQLTSPPTLVKIERTQQQEF